MALFLLVSSLVLTAAMWTALLSLRAGRAAPRAARAPLRGIVPGRRRDDA